jgi:hypothetical protein
MYVQKPYENRCKVHRSASACRVQWSKFARVQCSSASSVGKLKAVAQTLAYVYMNIWHEFDKVAHLGHDV